MALREVSEEGHLLELGLSSAPSVGPSVRISSRPNGWYRAYGLDLVNGARTTRLMALVDVGAALPLRRPWSVVASWVFGLDARERPTIAVAGALGARVRLEWVPPRRWPVRLWHVSLTALTDFPPVAIGERTPGGRLFATFGTAIDFPRP
jgi:hypothetical protein